MFSEFGSIDSVTLVSENGQSAASMILHIPVSILRKFEDLWFIPGVLSTVSSFIVLGGCWRVWLEVWEIPISPFLFLHLIFLPSPYASLPPPPPLFFFPFTFLKVPLCCKLPLIFIFHNFSYFLGHLFTVYGMCTLVYGYSIFCQYTALFFYFKFSCLWFGEPHFFIMCMNVPYICMHACTPVHRMCALCPWKAEEVVGSPELELLMVESYHDLLFL